MKFIGTAKDLKKLGYKFELYTSYRAMTWVLCNPENKYECIRIWKSGNIPIISNKSISESRTIIETVLNEELFDDTECVLDDRRYYIFMIDNKTSQFAPFVKEKHDSSYILSRVGIDPTEDIKAAVNTCLAETRDKNIVKLNHDEWIINAIRNIKPLINLKSE